MFPRSSGSLIPRDFPGGWPGDPRDAFTRDGRTPEEQSVFDHVRRLLRLRAEIEPLRRGRLVTLAAGKWTYAYARVSGSAWAIVALNSGSRPEVMEFELPAGFPAGAVALEDRLGDATAARIRDGRIALELHPHSAAIYTSLENKPR